jgi:hypothetical protein
MTNHIHVIVVQGRRPLSAYMQPLLRRIALVVIRRRNREGHVFAGRYCHNVCRDPEYFRSMVAYVHLNPVRAGICRRPADYKWTSHHDYACPELDTPVRYGLAVEQGLRVFAHRSEQSIAGCRRDYRAFMRWRQKMDDYLRDDSDSWHPIPHIPQSIGGDLHWHREYGTAHTLRITGSSALPVPLPDLRDHVRAVLGDIAPDLPLDLLRAGGSSRRLVRVRNQVIARSVNAGYVGIKLAQFLNVSPSTVSRIRSLLRQGAAL